MAQVFLSYQKRDWALAQRMDHALSRAGLSVWWDEDINPRESWDREIEREIEKADFVLALWTKNSVDSEWVRIEAHTAKGYKPSKLLQARFDDCRIPLAFTFTQYVDLNPEQPEEGLGWGKLLRWLNVSEANSLPPIKPARKTRPDPKVAFSGGPVRHSSDQMGKVDGDDQRKSAGALPRGLPPGTEQAADAAGSRSQPPAVPIASQRRPTKGRASPNYSRRLLLFISMGLAVAVVAALLAQIRARGAEGLEPGQWETTIQFSSLEAPGVPEAQLAPMRTTIDQPQSHSECMTPDQAANPAGRMMNPGAGANACQYVENVFAGGTIRVHGTCEQPGRGPMQINMDGTYTATTMQATLTSETHAPPGTPGPQLVRMSGALTARRTGDCPPGR